jgi:hypothetical protein
MRGIVIGAAALVICGAGIAGVGVLYAAHIVTPTLSSTAHRPAIAANLGRHEASKRLNPAQIEAATLASTVASYESGKMLPSKLEREAAYQQTAAGLANMAAAGSVAALGLLRDLQATGDLKVSAEWSALDDAHYPTLCGISPTYRRYTLQNEIGKVIHDNPLETDWKQVGCARTSPVHQGEILKRAYERQLYEATHPLDAECILGEIHGLAAGDANAIDKDDCRRSDSKR